MRLTSGNGYIGNGDILGTIVLYFLNDLKKEDRKDWVITPPPVWKGKHLEFNDYPRSLINRIHGERFIVNKQEHYDYMLWILKKCTADVIYFFLWHDTSLL